MSASGKKLQLDPTILKSSIIPPKESGPAILRIPYEEGDEQKKCKVGLRSSGNRRVALSLTSGPCQSVQVTSQAKIIVPYASIYL